MMLFCFLALAGLIVSTFCFVQQQNRGDRLQLANDIGKRGTTVVSDAGVINDICFGPDGKLIIALADGNLQSWKVDAPRVALVERARHGAIWSLAASKHSSMLFAASATAVDAWSLDAVGFLRTITVAGKDMRTIRSDADGTSFVTVDRSGQCSVWKAGRGNWSLVSDLQNGSAWGMYPCDISSDGNLVAFGDREHDRIRIWDCKVRREVRALACNPSDLFVWDFAFINHSHDIVATGSDNVSVWNADSGVRRTKIEIGYAWAVASSDNGRILVVSEGKRIFVVDANSGAILETIDTERNGIVRLAIAPNSEWIAALHYYYANDQPGSSEVSLWRLPQGK